MKTFLVAIDNSPVSRTVLEQAVTLARTSNARLILLRVVGLPLELPEMTLSGSPEDVSTMLEGVARTDLAHLSGVVPAELVAKTRVELGSPWQKICEAATEEKADLIIIGSHGHSVLDRLLGTTATRVVNHANQSVLVVRPPQA
jgi:nucleotide-binding universal stress UspA family protein